MNFDDGNDEHGVEKNHIHLAYRRGLAYVF